MLNVAGGSNGRTSALEVKSVQLEDETLILCYVGVLSLNCQVQEIIVGSEREPSLTLLELSVIAIQYTSSSTPISA